MPIPGENHVPDSVRACFGVGPHMQDAGSYVMPRVMPIMHGDYSDPPSPEDVLSAVERMSPDQLRRLAEILARATTSPVLYTPSPSGVGWLAPTISPPLPIPTTTF